MAWPVIVAGALAAGGALANYMGKKSDADRASEAYDAISAASDAANTANQADIAKWQQFVEDTYGEGAAKYSDALQAFLDSPVYQNEGFQYNNDISNFMDPAMNQRVDAAMQAINNSASSNGNRFSSDFINRVGARQQSLASEEWEKAYNRLMQDRQIALQEYNTNSQNNWNNYNATNARNLAAVDAYGRDREGYVGGMGDALSAGIMSRNGNLNTQAQMISNNAQANQGTSGWDLLAGLGGAGGQFLSNWFGKGG